MELLQNLVEHSMDDDYYAVAGRQGGGRSTTASQVAVMTVLALFATLVVVAAVQTRVALPASQNERAALIVQVNEEKDIVSERQAALATLQRDVAALQETTTDATLSGVIEQQQVVAGSVPVAGPGVRIIVDNAGDADRNSRGRVLDSDLQLLVNGLWFSGAEAVAINEHRLTSLSSIRSAGEAITVNYRSLTPPYTVTAVGDPRTLQARFLETPAGLTWANLEANFGLRFDADVRPDLQLPAAPESRTAVRYAAPVRTAS